MNAARGYDKSILDECTRVSSNKNKNNHVSSRTDAGKICAPFKLRYSEFTENGLWIARTISRIIHLTRIDAPSFRFVQPPTCFWSDTTASVVGREVCFSSYRQGSETFLFVLYLRGPPSRVGVVHLSRIIYVEGSKTSYCKREPFRGTVTRLVFYKGEFSIL